MKQVFVVAPGQFDNVGDTMHRRVLLDWLRPAGHLHVFVGDAPTSFVQGLRLGPDDRVYRSFPAWLSTLVLKSGARAVLAFNPGEMSLSAKRVLGEIALAPIVLLLRARKGSVLRLGVAAGNDWTFPNRFVATALRALLRLTTDLRWREVRSLDLFGLGSATPDLAFALGRVETESPSATCDRPLLVVTMRYDRPQANEAWLRAVSEIAAERSLRVHVVSQVRRDNVRSATLAEAFGVPADLWDDGDHEQQEQRLRTTYAQAAFVVSDRLHALIAGATEGALPLGLLPQAADKVAVHFAAVGIEHVAMDTSTATTADIRRFVDLAVADSAGTRRSVVNARETLEEVRVSVLDRLDRGRRSTRPGDSGQVTDHTPLAPRASDGDAARGATTPANFS